jgi:hypothetical protein
MINLMPKTVKNTRSHHIALRYTISKLGKSYIDIDLYQKQAKKRSHITSEGRSPLSITL